MDATLKPLCVPCTFADAHRLLLESEALEFALVDAGGALLGAVPRAYLDLQIEHILCSSDGGRKRPAPLLDKIATKMTEALGSPRSWTITRHLSLTSLGVGDGDNRRSRRSLARSRSLDRSSLGGELARQQPLAPAPAEPSDSTELTAMAHQHQPQPQQPQPQPQQPQQTQHQPPQHQQTPQPQPPPQQTTTQQPLPATTTASASLAAATPDAACAVQPSGSADALSASPASVSPSAASSGSDTQRASTAAGRPGNPSPAPGLGIERAPSRMTRAQRLQRRNSGLVSPSFGVPPSAASSPGRRSPEVNRDSAEIRRRVHRVGARAARPAARPRCAAPRHGRVDGHRPLAPHRRQPRAHRRARRDVARHGAHAVFALCDGARVRHVRGPIRWRDPPLAADWRGGRRRVTTCAAFEAVVCSSSSHRRVYQMSGAAVSASPAPCVQFRGVSCACALRQRNGSACRGTCPYLH